MEEWRRMRVVVPATEASNGQSVPVQQAANGRGILVVIVASGGVPVVERGNPAV
jgi:hypothetical protein